jgi:hypothetical protein
MNEPAPVPTLDPIVPSSSADAAALGLKAADRRDVGPDRTGWAPVSAGTIVTRSFAVLHTRLIVVMAMAAIVLAPELVLLLGVRHGYFLSWIEPFVGRPFLFLLFWFAVRSLLGGILAAPIAYIVVMAMRGTPAPLAETIRQGLRRLVPSSLTSLVGFSLGAVASFLLLVPGIIVFSMLNVAVPAVVVERIGVFAALGRSRQLTRGYRASIFGAFVLWVAAYMFVQWLSGIFVNSAGGDAAVVLVWGLDVLFGAWAAVNAAVTYHDLRVGKEGVDTSELARVFD